MKFGYQMIRQRENDISGLAALRDLYISLQPERESADPQYRQFLRDIPARARYRRRTSPISCTTTCPRWTMNQFYAQDELENSPRPDTLARHPLQPGDAGQYPVRPEIVLRSQCHRSRQRAEGRHRASGGQPLRHEHAQLHAAHWPGLEFQAEVRISRVIRNVHAGPRPHPRPG